MNIEEILALYNSEQRQRALVPGMRSERDGAIVRLVMEAEEEGLSYVSYSDLTEQDADREIERQIDYFTDLARGFEWAVYDYDRPADLGARLLARGFEGEEEEALLVLALLGAPPRLLAPPAAGVREITDTAELESVRRLLAAVWNEPFDWFPPRMARYLNSDYMSLYVADVDGEPASAAWIFMPEQSTFASLYGGSTLKQFRGRGLYTELVAVRAQEALRRGYRFLTIDAGDMSRPIVEKLGFRLLANVTPYVLQVK